MMALLRYLKPEQKKSSLLDPRGPLSEKNANPSDPIILFKSGQSLKVLTLKIIATYGKTIFSNKVYWVLSA